MSHEDNKTLVRRFWQAFESNDMAALNTILSPRLVSQSSASSDRQSRDNHLNGIAMFNAAFTDRRFTLETIIAEGDQVATVITLRGVHTGEWQGLPPTGKPFTTTGLTLETIADGMIVHRRISFDTARVMQDLATP